MRRTAHMVTIVNPAGERFVGALLELAPLYGFGTVHDKGYAARGGYAHAAYLAKYVAKDGETRYRGASRCWRHRSFLDRRCGSPPS